MSNVCYVSYIMCFFHSFSYLRLVRLPNQFSRALAAESKDLSEMQGRERGGWEESERGERERRRGNKRESQREKTGNKIQM